VKVYQSLILFVVLSFPLFANAQTLLVLRPDSAAGKDTEVFSCIQCGYSNTNYGWIQDLNSISWTNGGHLSYVRSLIEFDLSAIPANTTLTQAKLSLYFNPTCTEGQHSSLTNSNESVLRRIVTPWGEHSVTWNTQPFTTLTNEVILPQSTSPTQNYLNIDVTNMVQDMIDYPSSSYGFQLRPVVEETYKRLIFASSDHPNKDLHPKLEITFPSVSAIAESIADRISIYPNPVKDKLTIHSDRLTVTSIEISNALGQNVTTITSPGQTEVVPVEQFSKGLYFVKLHCDNQVLVKKIILE
jgi:hypothetical protein